MPNRVLRIIGAALVVAAIARPGARRLLGASGATQSGGAIAELFASDAVSANLDELAVTFVPGGDTVYYAISSAGPAADQLGVLVRSHRAKNRWRPPAVAPFSGKYSDYDPFVTRDGTRLFFVLNRPDTGRTKARADYDIWIVERQGNRWGDPHNLGTPVNSPAPEYYPSVATDGTLYFSTVRPDSKGHFDIYRARPIDGEYGAPKNLGAILNGPYDNIDNVISPDQSYIIFASYGRPDALETGDLYISFNHDDAWTAPRNLGAPINSVALDYTPSLSPDGKYLYWSSNRGFEDRPLTRSLSMREFRDSMAGIRNGNGNIYRTPLAPLLDRLAPAPGGGAPGGPVISVGGTYNTDVTLLDNSCGPVTIERHETIVSQAPGDTTLTVSHAGGVYAGRLRPQGLFTTTTRTILDPGGTIGIAIAGRFTRTAIDANVTVTIARSVPCRYTVRWHGPKQGAPNEIP